MLIKRIKATNFKTYLSLDLDIAVEDDKPLILIGGENGGGKTTLFEAIYGALYGLHIHTVKQFTELLNAGSLGIEKPQIILELHFSGRVLNEEQQYVLTRTYALNPLDLPVENVKLNIEPTDIEDEILKYLKSYHYQLENNKLKIGLSNIHNKSI